MIDKTGNSDTHSKLLSGSGSLEMKSDGLSLGLSAYDWGTASDGRKQVHLWMRMTTCHMLDNSSLSLGNKQRDVYNEIVLQGL